MTYTAAQVGATPQLNVLAGLGNGKILQNYDESME